jgi:hypothetical protein
MSMGVPRRCLLAMCLAAVGCQKSDDRKPAPPVLPGGTAGGNTTIALDADGRPKPPLDLAEPPAEPAQIDGRDLSKLELAELESQARSLAARHRYAKAAQYQYWFAKRAEEGRYDLACWYSLAGNKDAAFYWLQVAARDDGVDFGHATIRDTDMNPLKGDPRWSHWFPTCRPARNTGSARVNRAPRSSCRMAMRRVIQLRSWFGCTVWARTRKGS